MPKRVGGLLTAARIYDDVKSPSPEARETGQVRPSYIEIGI